MLGGRSLPPLTGVVLAALLGGLLVTAGPPVGSGATVTGCHPGRGAVCIGRSDGGRTVHVRVGETVTVGLGGSGLRWSGLHQVGPHLLHQRGGTVRRQGTLTASYLATGEGRTRLQASGAPNCAPGEACPQFVVLWQVGVVVAGRHSR